MSTKAPLKERSAPAENPALETGDVVEYRGRNYRFGYVCDGVAHLVEDINMDKWVEAPEDAVTLVSRETDKTTLRVLRLIVLISRPVRERSRATMGIKGSR